MARVTAHPTRHLAGPASAGLLELDQRAVAQRFLRRDRDCKFTSAFTAVGVEVIRTPTPPTRTRDCATPPARGPGGSARCAASPPPRPSTSRSATQPDGRLTTHLLHSRYPGSPRP